MSTMALLTYGRDNNLSRKEGWLRDLLTAEGSVSNRFFTKLLCDGNARDLHPTKKIPTTIFLINVWDHE
jgi:hypothetical protein